MMGSMEMDLAFTYGSILDWQGLFTSMEDGILGGS